MSEISGGLPWSCLTTALTRSFTCLRGWPRDPRLLGQRGCGAERPRPATLLGPLGRSWPAPWPRLVSVSLAGIIPAPAPAPAGTVLTPIPVAAVAFPAPVPTAAPAVLLAALPASRSAPVPPSWPPSGTVPPSGPVPAPWPWPSVPTVMSARWRPLHARCPADLSPPPVTFSTPTSAFVSTVLPRAPAPAAAHLFPLLFLFVLPPFFSPSAAWPTSTSFPPFSPLFIFLWFPPLLPLPTTRVGAVTQGWLGVLLRIHTLYGCLRLIVLFIRPIRCAIVWLGWVYLRVLGWDKFHRFSISCKINRTWVTKILGF